MSSYDKWNEYWWNESLQEGTSDLVLAAIEQNTPRPEYSRRELRLNYRHDFSTGHAIEAKEKESGLVEVILYLSDGKKVNFLEEHFVPSGLKLISPTYARNHNLGNELIQQGYWWAEDTFISMGDMKNPQSFFAFLHELGHKQPELLQQLKVTDAHVAKPKFHEAQYQSVNERGAWFGALQIVRYLKTKYGVNLMELFSSVKDLRDFMEGNLIAHRYRQQFDAIIAQKDLLSEEEISDEFGNLFDKPRPVGFGLKPVDFKRAA